MPISRKLSVVIDLDLTKGLLLILMRLVLAVEEFGGTMDDVTKALRDQYEQFPYPVGTFGTDGRKLIAAAFVSQGLWARYGAACVGLGLRRGLFFCGVFAGRGDFE